MSQLLTEAELNAIAAKFGTFTYPDAAVSRLLALGREYYALRAKLRELILDLEHDKSEERNLNVVFAHADTMRAIEALLGEDKP